MLANGIKVLLRKEVYSDMKYNKYRFRFLMTLAVTVLLFAFGPARPTQAAPEKGAKIADGVWAGDLDLSGKTEDEARQLLEDYFREMEQRTLKLYVYDNYVNKDNPGRTEGQTLLNSFSVSYSSLGFTWSVEETLQKAVSYGQTGKLIQRYKDLQNLKYDKAVLPLEYGINGQTIYNYIAQNVSPEVDHGATEARIAVSYPNIYVTAEASHGISVNVGVTAEKIQLLFSDGIPEDSSITVSVSYQDPLNSTADYSKMNAVLGEYTTLVELTEETRNRTHNITLEMEILNGTIVMPGEVFSIWGIMGNTTADKGFLPAGAFQPGGRMADEEGGGVCQGSTTIYCAALRAEMEIVERFAHSMVISYVPFAQDCALAWDYKDLKFRNNTDAPIYLETFVEGNRVVARIYGHETRPANRSLVFETTVTKREIYGPRYWLNHNANPGKPEVTGGIHMEAEAYCTKKVLVDGVVVSEEVIADDHYRPEQQTVAIGCNMLELYVRGDEYHEKVYDANNNQLLVDKDGIPYYNGTNGYLLVKDYQADSEGHAILDAQGRPIARSGQPTTESPEEHPCSLPRYKGRFDVDDYVAELGLRQLVVIQVKTVASKTAKGEICWVTYEDGETAVPVGSNLEPGTKVIVYVSGGKDYSPTDPTTEAPTEAPTEPPTEAPTEPPTEAPTEPPTEAPTEPPTEAPTEPPTEAPTEPPTTEASLPTMPTYAGRPISELFAELTGMGVPEDDIVIIYGTSQDHPEKDAVYFVSKTDKVEGKSEIKPGTELVPGKKIYIFVNKGED